MFKSVFAKYTSAFMLIIVLSFSVIICIVTAIIGQYSEEAKSDMMATAASSSAAYLEGIIEDNGNSDIETAIGVNRGRTAEMLSIISSEADDIFVLVSNTSGKIILSEGSEGANIKLGANIPDEFMSRVSSGEAFSQFSKLEGVLEGSVSIYAIPLKAADGSVSGGVFVCSESVMITELLTVIIKVIVMAILWVLLASIIAIYFISEKVITPLRDISRAAKSFAEGRFDVRVPVRGRDEVAQVAVAFNNMAESLNNYDNMRNSFMSNVSHDLRSPMTSIAGFVDGILDGVIPPEQHEYYLGVVSSEVKRLSRLVSSLLDLSRIQAGERKFSKKPFDICEVSRQIIISFEKKIDEKNMQVEFDVDEENISVLADRDAIYQVLYNLCDNAVKFSSEGGLLKISIKKLKNKKILVSVFNEGQGISNSDLSYVFDRFYKSDKSRGLNKNGVGLGLFISKTIIEAHEETIWVDSEYGKNCCFSFTLLSE